MVVTMLAGPSVAGVVLTGLVDGRRGLREFGSRLLKWRIGGAWYAVALLTAPLLSLGAAWTLSLFLPDVLPEVSLAEDKAATVLLGLVVGMTAGFFEELGWTGFAIPRLKRHYDVLTTGVVVGVLWSAWHVLVVAWGMGDRAGTIPLPIFMAVDGLAVLPAFRVLMVLVYDRTESLLAAVLMHASLTMSTLILTPHITGAAFLAHGVVFAAAAWVVLAAFNTIGRGRLSRQPMRRAAST